MHVRLIDGRWQVRDQDRTYLNLKIEVRSKTVRIAQVTLLFGNTLRVIYQGKKAWALRFSNLRQTYAASQLGYLRDAGANFCGNAARPNAGLQRFQREFTIKVGIVSGGGLTAVKEKRVSGYIYCHARPPVPRSADAPKPLRVRGARVRLTKIGQQCPRKVFAQVRIRTNKPGTVPYVLRSNWGRTWTRHMLVQFKNNRGNYEGRFDHAFQVKKSITEKFWVEIKGKRTGRPATLKVVCMKQGPKGMSK